MATAALSADFKLQSATNPVGTAVTKTASPANGVSVVALTGDGVAVKVASVLGTGMNTDTLTNGVEAV